MENMGKGRAHAEEDYKHSVISVYEVTLVNLVNSIIQVSA